MRPLLTRKRMVWLTVVAAIFLLMAEAFVTPPAHEVHVPGGIALNTSLVDSDIRLQGTSVQPSQSISDVRCQLWQAMHRTANCLGDDPSPYFPNINQNPNTLYVLWIACMNWGGSGPMTDYQGYNVEYLSSRRKLVIHC